MTRCITFWQKIRRFPPATIRVLARHPRGKLLTDQIIADRAGLTVDEVALLGASFHWSISVDKMKRFLDACGIDLENRSQMQRISAYLRADPKWLHLRNDPEWHSRWLPQLKEIANYMYVAARDNA